MILPINNLHPFSKKYSFFFHFCGPTCMCTHCKLDCPPPWGACTGSFENLRPKWWRDALFCLNITVRPMARIFWKRCNVLKKKKKTIVVKIWKKIQKEKKKTLFVAKSGPFISYGCRLINSGTVLYRSMNRVLKCDIIFFFFHFTQHFHNHISVGHDEKPSHTKFDMNWFMVARDMTPPGFRNTKCILELSYLLLTDHFTSLHQNCGIFSLLHFVHLVLWLCLRNNWKLLIFFFFLVFYFLFLFMLDAHHGINSSTKKYQSTQSSVVLTSCRQDSGSPPF